jgi:hypothetical protein
MIGVSNKSPGFGHSFRGGLLRTRWFAFATGHKGRHQLERVRPKGPGDDNEFHDIQSTLPALVFCNKGLRFFRRRARACWVSPAALRARTISSQKAAWSDEWMDLPIPRVPDVISRAS